MCGTKTSLPGQHPLKSSLASEAKMTDTLPDEIASCANEGHKPKPFPYDPHLDNDWCTCACGKRIYFRDIRSVQKALKRPEIVAANVLNTP